MYISKLNLNLNSGKVRYELNNCYEFHRTLCSCFPDKSKGGTGRILYRVENFLGLNSDFTMNILLVSKIEPDWSILTSKDNYLINYVIKKYDPIIKDKEIFKFHLRANPTKKKDGKRIGLYGNEEQINWLIRKSKDNGFEILDCINKNDDYLKSSNEKNLEFLSVLFEGVLKVSDVQKFKEALFNGIGSGKAFGFGLLTIAR